jgi:hypothetical protein
MTPLFPDLDPAAPAADDHKAFFDAIVAAGPKGLRVKAGWLVARPDGDFDLKLAAIHTIGHKPIGPDNPGHYGRTHDYDCPACLASGSSFLTSPRSETYWCS